MGEGKITALTTPTPLNRQSPNIAHVIMSTIPAHMQHLVKVATGVTSPHIAKVTTQFLSRVSILTRDIDIPNLSVCLSVCLSVRNVPVSDENGLTFRHSFSHHTVAQSF